MIHTAMVVRGIRHQMGWSRSELAQKLGVSVSKIIKVEHAKQILGDMTVNRLREITGGELKDIR